MTVGERSKNLRPLFRDSLSFTHHFLDVLTPVTSVSIQKCYPFISYAHVRSLADKPKLFYSDDFYRITVRTLDTF